MKGRGEEDEEIINNTQIFVQSPYEINSLLLVDKNMVSNRN